LKVQLRKLEGRTFLEADVVDDDRDERHRLVPSHPISIFRRERFYGRWGDLGAGGWFTRIASVIGILIRGDGILGRRDVKTPEDQQSDGQESRQCQERPRSLTTGSGSPGQAADREYVGESPRR
jgi:hypothetical protein